MVELLLQELDSCGVGPDLDLSESNTNIKSVKQ